MLLKKLQDSCTLTSGMAARLNMSISDAIEADPTVSAAAYRSAVLRCAGCKEQDACKTLQRENAQLDAAPDYCRNW